MGVKVTIQPHRVTDHNGHAVEFDQYQILIGQRVCGYLGKLAHCVPKLVVRDLPEDALAAINAACSEKLQTLCEAVVQQPIGARPKPDVPPPRPSEADSAELEAGLATER